MARMKTVRVKPEVYEAWTDYSAEHGVTIGEAAAILAGGAPELEGAEAPDSEAEDLGQAQGDWDPRERPATRGDIEELGGAMAVRFANAQGERGYIAQRVGGDPLEMEAAGVERTRQLLEEAGVSRREAARITRGFAALPGKRGR